MQHLAIIPDGNRRWAAKNKLESVFGHRKGMETLRFAIKVCLKNSIKYLSLYTFSLENFSRSQAEQSYFFKLFFEFKKELPELIEQGVCVRFLGDRSYFPNDVLSVIYEVEEQTKQCAKLFLNLLFCYGSQQEIVFAARSLAKKVQMGEMKLEDITPDSLKNSLWTSGMPDPDLIIRTGNTVRVSNFLLFQAAYSEYMFLDCFWPEVTEEVLQQCVNKFDTIQRNIGA
ncbi:di-trans,poly-cis-decaprenylcistransferase [Candidatus Babeliales bacterium]|nr:di-trans,poly-cis-decaprenylcistransferase [Candidatus Babeliales bacterium]